MPQVEVRPVPWAELVFHVLAHVPETQAFAASLWDADYVAYAERHLGSVYERELSLDTQVLGRIINGHRALSELGLLAWLFETPEQAERAALTNLDELVSNDVADPTVLVHLMQHRPQAEVLRCAALLEHEHFRRLPRPTLNDSQLEAQLANVAAAAPELVRCRVHLLLPLWRRGRVRGAHVWVGLPGAEPLPSSDHVAWQAAHEATVREVSAKASQVLERPEERGVEHAAVVLLTERAQEQGLNDAHRRWVAHFGNNAPPLNRGSLSADWQEVIDRCRAEME